MTPREERLLALEDRARSHVKTARGLAFIAKGFDRTERAEMWDRLRQRAEAHADYLWNLRVEAGARRWRADDERQALVVVE